MNKIILVFLVIFKSVNLLEVSYYEILGVTKQATTQEIKQAYKKLAVKLHPDKNSNKDEQARFLKITEAYEILKDPDERQKYDMYGSHSSYTRKYDYRSQQEYNDLYYNGLYHDDPFVDTLSGHNYYKYLSEGYSFVNFYSPFCPPCQNLVDHWKKLAEVYKGIIKVGAVNCKYHRSFCTNNMRITSYPTLIFYTNGHDDIEFYRGKRDYESMERFVMSQIRNGIDIPTIWRLKKTPRPLEESIAYVVDRNAIDTDALKRLAYRLQGVVKFFYVDDMELTAKLTASIETVVVLNCEGRFKEIQSSDESTILREIIEGLTKLEQIDRDKLKKIRTKQRNGSDETWILYFTANMENEDKVLVHMLQYRYTDYKFGEVDCVKWKELCASLQVESAPAWAVLKRGGVYQRAYNEQPNEFIRFAATATHLHSLSPADMRGILDGDVGAWMLLVVPHQVEWNYILDSFYDASTSRPYRGVNYGILACTASTNHHCRQWADNEPVVMLQNGTRRHVYRGQLHTQGLLQFIQFIKESDNIELTEQQALDMLDASSREHTWLVAYLPAGCGTFCAELAYEFLIVAKKLRPLDFVRVGYLQCTRQSSGLCHNVRQPTGRLYPIASGQHFTVNLRHVSHAPYILEWALEHIDDSVKKLNWQTFAKSVATQELTPKGEKKPWLVYFHSPRCYRCYEMYPDFAILSILLTNLIRFGKVNCLSERNLCHQEHITSYPSIKLYLQSHGTIALQPKDYSDLLQDIRPHLTRYNRNLLASIDGLVHGSQRIHLRHDEL